MSDDRIELWDGGATFIGYDATKLYQATALRIAIDAYVRTGMRVTRTYTPPAMAIAAGRITGKTYKPRKPSLAQASRDLTLWIEAMKSALPVVKRSE